MRYVYARRVDFSSLVFSLSSHRHIGLKKKMTFRDSELGNTIDSGMGLSITIDKFRVFINKTLSILSTYQEDLINRRCLSTVG